MTQFCWRKDSSGGLSCLPKARRGASTARKATADSDQWPKPITAFRSMGPPCDSDECGIWEGRRFPQLFLACAICLIALKCLRNNYAASPWGWKINKQKGRAGSNYKAGARSFTYFISQSHACIIYGMHLFFTLSDKYEHVSAS